MKRHKFVAGIDDHPELIGTAAEARAARHRARCAGSEKLKSPLVKARIVAHRAAGQPDCYERAVRSDRGAA
jgi:hypothetical protein